MIYKNRTEEFQKQIEACLSRKYPFVLYNDQENYVKVYPAEARITQTAGNTFIPTGDIDFEAFLQTCIDKYEHFHSLVPIPATPAEKVTIAIKNEAINGC